MMPFMMGLLLATLCAVPQQDEPAREAIRKLSERFRDVKTLSARVTQKRKSALLETPIVSSGTLCYRRDPARLVFRMTEPRITEIHLDRTSYQVYRPDEKRLERMDFEGDSSAAKLFLVFEPKPEEIGKGFAVRSGEAKDGALEVHLEPTDETVRKRLKKLSLTIAADGTLRRIAVTDGDGDDVEFELSELKADPDLPAETFELRVPEGTRVLRHAVKEGG